jgi:2Fe-2S ferredoxin
MPRITYLPIDGAPIEANPLPGMTLMEAALMADVPGIMGMCGGICSCATCHVVVAPEWRGKLTPPTPEERDMVDALTHSEPGSRLGCQVSINDDLDGLVVRVAEPE